ncbi:MAG TPA: hypothetical protein VMI31_08240 [Fimbriimonadaceae bacterium]|nr:hypothetical protein [Fimbriimonadaceae bacterium]
MTTQTKRGALVLGASLAALTAGWYIYRFYQKREHEEWLESEEMVREFDEEIAAMNESKPKPKSKRLPNGHHAKAES